MLTACACSKPKQLTLGGETCTSCKESWANCCCPRGNYTSCPDCKTTVVSNIAECSDSQLNQNNCIIVSGSSVISSKDCQNTVSDVLRLAYLTTNKTALCPKFTDDYLYFYNAAVSELNAFMPGLWVSTQALMKTCKRCYFDEPPQSQKIITVTTDVEKCNQYCSKTKYSFLESELWSASRVFSSWTRKDGMILVKDPKTCGCGFEPPEFLMVDYYRGIPPAGSVDDCLDSSFPAEIAAMIAHTIVKSYFGIKYENQLAISMARNILDEYKDMYRNHDMRHVESKPQTKLRPTVRIGG